jgi:hypothetical protein
MQMPFLLGDENAGGGPEFRGAERTDVIRTTRSTFQIRGVGSKSAILEVKLFQGSKILEEIDYRSLASAYWENIIF